MFRPEHKSSPRLISGKWWDCGSATRFRQMPVNCSPAVKCRVETFCGFQRLPVSECSVCCKMPRTNTLPGPPQRTPVAVHNGGLVPSAPRGAPGAHCNQIPNYWVGVSAAAVPTLAMNCLSAVKRPVATLCGIQRFPVKCRVETRCWDRQHRTPVSTQRPVRAAFIAAALFLAAKNLLFPTRPISGTHKYVTNDLRRARAQAFRPRLDGMPGCSSSHISVLADSPMICTSWVITDRIAGPTAHRVPPARVCYIPRSARACLLHTGAGRYPLGVDAGRRLSVLAAHCAYHMRVCYMFV